MGEIVQLYLRPSARTPVKAVSQAVAVAGAGLEGDHTRGGKRQLTLLSHEGWRDALAELGVELDPGARRANVLVSGVDLRGAIGQRLRLGEVELEVVGETKPCQLLDDIQLGLHDALRPACRGGVFGKILRGGVLAVGQPVTQVTAEDASA